MAVSARQSPMKRKRSKYDRVAGKLQSDTWLDESDNVTPYERGFIDQCIVHGRFDLVLQAIYPSTPVSVGSNKIMKTFVTLVTLTGRLVKNENGHSVNHETFQCNKKEVFYKKTLASMIPVMVL